MKIFGVPIVIDFSVSPEVSQQLQEDSAVNTLQDLYEECEEEEEEEGKTAFLSLLGNYGVRLENDEWVYE